MALAIALGSGAAVAEPGVTDAEIVVGGVSPFTGPGGLLGYAGTLGTRLAAAEINAKGGINGRQLRVVVEDDEYVPAKSVQALQKLIDVNDIFSLNIISGGSHGLAMMPLIEEGNIPTMNPLVTTNAHYDPVRPSVFGVGMSYQQGAAEIVKFIEEKHGPQVWGSIVQDDESGAAREQGLVAQLEADGKEPPKLMLRFKRDQTDFASEIMRAREAGLTAIILGGLPTGHASILKEAAKIGYKPHFAAAWVDHIPPTIGLFGTEGDGVYIYDFVPTMTDPQLEPFLALAAQHLPAEELPKLNRYAVIAYNALHIQAAAMKACGEDLTRDCVNQKIEETRDFDMGVMSPVSFSADRHLSDVKGHMLRIDAAAGKFVPAD
ncbi:ABC transporter substrate-binding protein [Paracoccus sp. DMF]|nr:ABC transporter substrate-binding protein [Paracoccus sp. DMF]